MAEESIKYLEVNLIESQEAEGVIADVKLINKPEVEYDKAVLYVMGNPSGVFDENDSLKFIASFFGNVECEIIFFKGDDSVWEIEEIVEFNISTWFAGAHADLGHTLQILQNGENLELFPLPQARGNNDICFRIVVRVPFDMELTLFDTAIMVLDPRPKHIRALQVHYRLADYKDRNDLYTPPDEAMYHIDQEVGKWWVSPMTLGHGVHVIYVAPSVFHDLSNLVVSGMCLQTIEEGEGQFSFSVSGFFKTIL